MAERRQTRRLQPGAAAWLACACLCWLASPVHARALRRPHRPAHRQAQGAAPRIGAQPVFAGRARPVGNDAGVPLAAAVQAAAEQPDAATRALVDDALLAMTPSEKIAQLMMIGFAGTELTPYLTRYVGEQGVGGVALFGRNLKTAEQTRALTRSISALRAGRVSPFVAVDQEGGTVLRIRTGLSVLPGAMVLGAANSPALAYLAGRATGSDLLRLGFNMNFAPVLDVNSNPDNPVINTRSFGERASAVASLGVAFLRGQRAVGMFSVAKHFPGHGDTSADSHFAMPQVMHNARRLQEVELLPFRAAGQAGVDGIMTAHIALPLLPGAGSVPATLSPAILTGLLRRGLGYEGVVITDDLEMQGIAKRYGLGGAVVRALKAGADMPMVLWGEEGLTAALGAIEQALASGELTWARIDGSVRRILLAKAERGLLQGSAAALPDYAAEAVPQPAGTTKRPLLAASENAWHDALMARVAERGLTLASNDNHAWPLRRQGQRLLVAAPNGALLRAFKQLDDVDTYVLPDLPTEQERHRVAKELAAAAAHADRLVVAIANRYQVDMAKPAVYQAKQRAIVVSLASPYWRRDFPSEVAYFCSYSSLPAAQRAAAAAVVGRQVPPGRLPITLDADHLVGSRAQ